MMRYLLLGSAMILGMAGAAAAAPTGTDSTTSTMPAGEYNTIPTDRTTVNATKNAEKKKTADTTQTDSKPTPADSKPAPAPKDSQPPH